MEIFASKFEMKRLKRVLHKSRERERERKEGEKTEERRERERERESEFSIMERNDMYLNDSSCSYPLQFCADNFFKKIFKFFSSLIWYLS